MKRFLAGLIFLLSTTLCFGEAAAVSDAWDKKHADEPSVVLFSSYRVDLAGNGSYVERIHSIKRVQNELGMEAEGEIVVPYNSKHQVVKKLKVVLTDPQGRKHSPKMIQDTDLVTEGYYSDYRKKIVTMPNVVVGSVIDFDLEVFNKQDAIKGEFFLSVQLFDVSPFKHQIITVSAPEKKTLYFKEIYTTKKPRESHSKGRVTYVWEAKEDEGYNEALSKEVAMPPAIDFLPHVFISTLKDWARFSDWYWKEFSKNIRLTPAIKAKTLSLVKDQKDLRGKVAAISRYFQDNFRYVALDFDSHNFEPHPADEVFKNKFGDCKDQSVLMISMLKVLGIDAYPVLVRAREQGNFAFLLPDPGCFAHAIVAIRDGEKTYFVDPLEKGYLLEELPYALERDYAFLINSQGGEILQLPQIGMAQKISAKRAKTMLRADGSAMTEVEIVLDRQNSIDKRQQLKLATEQEKRMFLEVLENLTKGGEILNYEVLGLDDDHGFLMFKLKAENPEYIKPRGPFLIFGETDIDLNSSFPDKERKYPLWFDAEYEAVTSETYEIPQGFVFEYVPRSVDLKSSWLDIRVAYVRSGSKITQEVTQHYKPALIAPQDYKAFKDFLIRAERAFNECVIIKKVV